MTSWVPDRPTGDDFLPPADGKAGPVMSPRDRPYVPNGNGRQPTYRIADTSNPILKPWAKEQMEKANAEVRAGKVPFITRERCWPAGVPGFTVYTRVQPIHFYHGKHETIVDNYRTPHTDKIHVVERFKVIEGGNILQATVTVDDPGAFNMPWTGVQRWKRISRPLEEYLCEESNVGFYGYDVVPIPTAGK